MGITNIGNQVITYDFKEAIVSEGFNKLNYKLHPIGIYEGGEFSRISDTELSISPFIAFFQDDTAKVSVRIETQDTSSITVSNTNILVVCRFTWINTENNYADIIAIEPINLQANDFILGRLQYNGIVLTTNFDYSSRSWVKTKDIHYYDTIASYNVTPTNPISNSVNVFPSNGKFIHEGKEIELLAKTTSPAFTFPVSTNGRKDVVAINSDTNGIVILQGADSPSTPLPNVGSYHLPIAIVTFPPSTLSGVRPEYIEAIHPFFYKGSSISDQTIFDRLKTVSGQDNGLDGDLLDDKQGSYFIDKLHEIATELNVTIPV